MSNPYPIHVVVVGGGVLGASTGAHLVRAGARVTLVTSGVLADGASGRSLSWLNSSGERSPAYHYLRILGIDRYRTWRVSHSESARYLNFNGAIKWARSGKSLRDTYERERSRGYDSIWLSRAEVSSRLPDVRPEAVAREGAIFNPGEGWIDLTHLVPALVAEARASGARVVENAGKADVIVEGGIARGVRLSGGHTIVADHVVLATGAAVPGQLARLGVPVPDATVPACVVFTEPLLIPIRTVLNTPSVAIRPTPGGGIAMDAGWAERSIIVGPEGVPSIPQSTIDGLVAEAEKVLANGAALTVRHVGIGPKPIPGDGKPVVGEIDAVPGLSAIFTHSGATLGLILGELVAQEVVTGQKSPILDPFRIERFVTEAAQPGAHSETWTPASNR